MKNRNGHKRAENMTRKEYDILMYEQKREELCRQIKRDKAMYENKEEV